MISFTSDIDWAPDELIEDTLELFDKYRVKCTFFSTHYSEILKNCNKDLFEIAVHPNFNPLFSDNSKSIDRIIDELLEIHPDAKGVRSHSMLQSSQLIQKFSEKGFVYESNHFLPYHSKVKPYKLWTGMIRIPFNWEDDIHWSYGHGFDDHKMDLNDSGLNIFNFHPIHIFLNTENEQRYNDAKVFYKNPSKLRTFRNSKTEGSRDLLIRLLEHIKEHKLVTKTQFEIAKDFSSGATF